MITRLVVVVIDLTEYKENWFSVVRKIWSIFLEYLGISGITYSDEMLDVNSSICHSKLIFIRQHEKS